MNLEVQTHPQTTLRRQEIRRFLTARRASITPASVGLPGGARRRTPGLRREEVASLSGVGVTWYTWFEQGRDIRVSPETIRKLSRALRLPPSDEAYLMAIACPEDIPVHAEVATSALQAAVDGFTEAPAMVVDKVWNVIAYNRIADRLFEFETMRGAFAHNHLWRVFMDPSRRAKYVDYDKIAELGAGVLRQTQARMLHDPYLDALIQDLRDGSEVFRRLWETEVATMVEPMELVLAMAGESRLRFSTLRLRPANADNCILVLWLPVDEDTKRAIRRV